MVSILGWTFTHAARQDEAGHLVEATTLSAPFVADAIHPGALCGSQPQRAAVVRVKRGCWLSGLKQAGVLG